MDFVVLPCDARLRGRRFVKWQKISIETLYKRFDIDCSIVNSLFCQSGREKNSANFRGTMIKVVILIGGPMKGKT